MTHHRIPRSAYGRRNKHNDRTVSPPPDVSGPPPDHSATIGPFPFAAFPTDSPAGGEAIASVTITFRANGISLATDGDMTEQLFAALSLGLWAGLPFEGQFSLSDFMMDYMMHVLEPETHPPVELPTACMMIATALQTARANGGRWAPGEDPAATKGDAADGTGD